MVGYNVAAISNSSFALEKHMECYYQQSKRGEYWESIEDNFRTFILFQMLFHFLHVQLYIVIYQNKPFQANINRLLWCSSSAEKTKAKQILLVNYSHIVAMDTLATLTADKPVVIFSKSTCCISHSAKALICSFGANPTVFEVDKMENGQQIERALIQLGCRPTVPAVFIGQQYVGGADKLISLNVQNKLAPLLLGAKAIFIWSS
ncbi:hypothetical protein RJT34_22733 [Clitoria ternatea]|uniref:Glutaredoxin domain-containing protein n=1 Tax=Clitoria ternatea TaxID=43366 RepID=A0AAN9IEA5_CLITE